MQVWRAATKVDPIDLRPTGPPQLDNAARSFQQRLDKRLAAADTDADWQWRQLLAERSPGATADPFLPELEEKLTSLTRAGFDATQLVRSAAAAGPLPDDHPAAALWWRILDQLPKRRTKNPQPLRRSQRPGARTTKSRDQQRPGRARRRLPRSVRAAETSRRINNRPQPASSTCGHAGSHVTDGSIRPKAGTMNQVSAKKPARIRRTSESARLASRLGTVTACHRPSRTVQQAVPNRR